MIIGGLDWGSGIHRSAPAAPDIRLVDERSARLERHGEAPSTCQRLQTTGAGRASDIAAAAWSVDGDGRVRQYFRTVRAGRASDLDARRLVRRHHYVMT